MVAYVFIHVAGGDTISNLLLFRQEKQPIPDYEPGFK